MPKVGGKHFAYTPEGKKAAKKEAERSGQPIEMAAKRGGRFKKRK